MLKNTAEFCAIEQAGEHPVVGVYPLLLNDHKTDELRQRNG